MKSLIFIFSFLFPILADLQKANIVTSIDEKFALEESDQEAVVIVKELGEHRFQARFPQRPQLLEKKGETSYFLETKEGKFFLFWSQRKPQNLSMFTKAKTHPIDHWYVTIAIQEKEANSSMKDTFFSSFQMRKK